MGKTLRCEARFGDLFAWTFWMPVLLDPHGGAEGSRTDALVQTPAPGARCARGSSGPEILRLLALIFL